MKTVLLKNKTRQTQVFNLDSPYWSKNRNETKWGQPCSITFLALEEKECDDAVLACAEIKAALSAQPNVLRLLTRKKAEPVTIPDISGADFGD